MAGRPEQRVYVYHWGKYIPSWKGRQCVVVIRGRTMNSALIEFIDNGERAIVSRNALRRAQAGLARAKES